MTVFRLKNLPSGSSLAIFFVSHVLKVKVLISFRNPFSGVVVLAPVKVIKGGLLSKSLFFSAEFVESKKFREQSFDSIVETLLVLETKFQLPTEL